MPKPTALRVLLGIAAVAVALAIVILALSAYRGAFTRTVALTVMSPRAGLVMDNGAKVNLLGVPVGRVSSIEDRADGQAAIHLEVDPDQLAQIPDNVVVDISSPTVFGAKSVNLVPPADPSGHALRPGQVLDTDHVTVEFNTIFEQLSSVLSQIQPDKLNETLSAIAQAVDGRGRQFGATMDQLDRYLAKLEPTLPSLRRDLSDTPVVADAYADAAPDLIAITNNATTISDTVFEERQNLDALLVSTIGLADIGTDVIGGNRQGLADLVHLLVPTLDLTERYHQSINCGLAGLLPLALSPPLDKPGIVDSIAFQYGRERYRYPSNLPKVAATGGPHCLSLPTVPYNSRPPFVVADVGSDPSQYGNQGLLLNSDGLKQLLFGPIDGPPRNSAQIGQPG